MSKIKTRIKKPPTRMLRALAIVLLFAVSLFVSMSLTSCNVTRRVTTQSEYVSRGDTSVMIVTKTIETYDASKKLP